MELVGTTDAITTELSTTMQQQIGTTHHVIDRVEPAVPVCTVHSSWRPDYFKASEAANASGVHSKKRERCSYENDSQTTLFLAAVAMTNTSDRRNDSQSDRDKRSGEKRLLIIKTS
jgi:hypothetical protein